MAVMGFPAADGLQSPVAASSGPWQQNRHVGSVLGHQHHLENGCVFQSYKGKRPVCQQDQREWRWFQESDFVSQLRCAVCVSGSHVQPQDGSVGEVLNCFNK